MAWSTYVYFAFDGDNFDPKEITQRLGIEPTHFWSKGDDLQYKKNSDFSSWKWSTVPGKEEIFIEELVEEVVEKFYSKIDAIVNLKKELELTTRLEIVLYIDVNEEKSTPALGHSLHAIEFLYKTQTVTDVDIYKYDSSKVI